MRRFRLRASRRKAATQIDAATLPHYALKKRKDDAYKALMILDQVPFRRIPASWPSGWLKPRKLALQHLPRTTPVGHATISTGLEPNVHRIQGRLWYTWDGVRWQPVNVDRLAYGKGFDGTIEANLRKHSLAAQIRASKNDCADAPLS